jgi:hypothetical protein
LEARLAGEERQDVSATPQEVLYEVSVVRHALRSARPNA